jgi:hypothetical protein
MTTPPEPEHINFFLEHIGKILGALAAILLGWMKYFSDSKRTATATIAKAVLTETPVSHTELLKCQMEVNKALDANFKELRKELMDEIRRLHKRIDTL